MDNKPISGAEQIIIERVHQEEIIGYTPEHDDKHTKGELILAAVCYMSEAYRAIAQGYVPGQDGINPAWPWEESSWNPGSDVEQILVKAGALIAAEIDRIQRLPKVIPESASSRP